ncbi:phage portal protein%2C HK97 family [Turicibacter sanguinis]|nr:phage portal protein%2C HK97 family [Turicibacter sanguinis]
MGILDRVKTVFNKNVTVSRFEMMTEAGTGFYSFNGELYKSDIIRACIRPKAKAIGKLVATHVREDEKGLKINPDAYMRFLLEEPNPYMSGQMLQEKVITQLMLNNNAFIYIHRDDNGYPVELYPVPATFVEAIYDKYGFLYLRCTLKNGKICTYPYSDIIHLRRDFANHDIFGDKPHDALIPLMEVVTTTDQSIIKAIKNSSVVKWLLKFNQALRPDDIKKQTKDFVKDYLKIDGETGGAAATDAKFDAKQVDPKDYVPNAAVMDRTKDRLYSFFNTNDKIVKSDYDENEWNAYYESEIEPDALQLSNEYTRRLFTRRERGFGNKIIFESSNLQYASMTTKLQLVQLVDRGAMLPNEWRRILGMGPIEGGNKPIRRLDTAVVGNGDNTDDLKGGES